jgi:UTP-glucose-1-phosphate uridylyltransferase
MKPTLVILAAGMASRYGSMKQIQSFGPSGETIMDYSIFDAIRAGFGKVVFIIREDFAEDFKDIFEPKLNGKVETAYVFQRLEDHLGKHSVPAERKKPWGTAHAVLAAKDAVREPFAVINADDFYGKDAFQKAHDFLVNDCNDSTYCIIGYQLNKTLSENGSVSRGVCEVDEKGNLISIAERTKIYRNETGKITYEDKDGLHEVSEDSKVSMNFWGFAPNVFAIIEEQFHKYLDENIQDPKAEFFIPIVADQFIKSGMGVINVIPTDSQWFGVTYKEDAPGVQASLDSLVDAGEYPTNLWNNA